MLKENQLIQVCWHPKTRDHYIGKGYQYTQMRDRFIVKAEDLSTGSHKKVEVICDYCSQVLEKDYTNYLSERKNGKDCCKKCRPLKTKETFLHIYGCDNPFANEDVKDKIKQTCLKKYGTERACQSVVIKSKIAETNLEKYGATMALQNATVKQKSIETCMEKYGVENVFKSPIFQEKARKTCEERYGEGNIAQTPLISKKIKLTNLRKYGVPYTTQAKEVIAKMRESLYKNGNVPSSKAEKEVCSILKELYGEENCCENYPLDRVNFDCLVILNDIKIDVEYDGWYWHKNRKEYDKRRNYYVLKQGYKVLRFKANNEIPTKEQIQEAIDCLIHTDKTLIEIELDI